MSVLCVYSLSLFGVEEREGIGEDRECGGEDREGIGEDRESSDEETVGTGEDR